jgi:hypothetical protein
MTKQKRVTIFYSWQSDSGLETNLKAIRNAIRLSANEIETEIPNLHIILDEATRDTAGSPNIPSTIFQKLDSCDIFISDITTINLEATNVKKKTGNPNVLIELGYAISVVGFGRMVLLFNKQHGIFPTELPFDIDRNRISDYHVKDKADTSGKNDLKSLLKSAIKIIIEKDPLKPSQLKQLTPNEKRKRYDVVNLTKILSTINIPALDLFLVDAPQVVHDRIFHYWESFKAIRDGGLFALYDTRAKELIDKIYDSWNKALNHGDEYRNPTHGHVYLFGSPSDTPRTTHERKTYEEILIAVSDLKKYSKELFNHLRQEYLEIDLRETSKIAQDEFTAFHQEIS